jgi:hypothetical protein
MNITLPNLVDSLLNYVRLFAVVTDKDFMPAKPTGGAESTSNKIQMD